jgi:hypothetical protein
MMGGRRIKLWQHFIGEKCSQIVEEKIQQYLSNVEAPWRRILSSWRRMARA